MSRNPTMVSGIEIDQGNDAGTDESERSYSVNVLASTSSNVLLSALKQ